MPVVCCLVFTPKCFCFAFFLTILLYFESGLMFPLRNYCEVFRGVLCCPIEIYIFLVVYLHLLFLYCCRGVLFPVMGSPNCSHN